MDIISLAFLLFLPITLILYRIFPARLRWFVLLVAGYVFLGIYNPLSLLAIILITLVTYICARKIESEIETTKKRFYLILSTVVSVGSLIAYKYFDFFVDEIIKFISIFGISLRSVTLNLVIPIGISFIALRSIAYTVEVFRKKIKPEKHFGYYSLYLSFFPTLFAGPIEKPAEFIEQLKLKKPFAGYDGARGLKLLGVGFFKIAVVSRQVAFYVDLVYSNVGSINANLMNGFTVFLSTVLFMAQIYCDFSGYCDIAAGCSALMGIKLSTSYNAPYLANGINDFLYRWNITVNNWFDSYVLQPIKGEGESKIKKYIAIAVACLLGGLWYGAEWSFIVLGATVGAMIILSELLAPFGAKVLNSFGLKPEGKLVKAVKRLFMIFLSFVFAMLVRADDIVDFGRLFATLLAGWSGVSLATSLSEIGMTMLTLVTVLASIYSVVLLDKQISLEKDKLRLNSVARAERVQAYTVLGWAIAIAFLMLLVSDTGIYQYFVF